jgi:cytochrome c oxidase subunit 3
LEEHKRCASLIASTLCCAMIFLGVKAIEYSHKWHMGLLPAGLFSYDPAHPHHEGGPNYLAYLSAPFAIATVGVAIWLVASLVRGKKFQFECAKPLLVVCLSFFVGVGLGIVLESGEAEASADAGHHTLEAIEHEDEHAHGDDDMHANVVEPALVEGKLDDADVGGADMVPPGAVREGGDLEVVERLASDATNTGLQDELSAREAQAAMAYGGIRYNVTDDASATIDTVEENVLRPSRAGVFFSIYYCMTGVHAIHILAGIAVLVWLLVRALRQDFNRNYFGPVDYVGLYWHLVDLIWIYLFPLMYLIR